MFTLLTLGQVRAENRPLVVSKADTLYAEPEQITLLKFPVKVLKCVSDDNIEADIHDKSVFFVAYDNGRMFVMLENGLVPSYVIRVRPNSPASYTFYLTEETSGDSLLYDEVSQLIRAMYHEKPLGSYYIIDGKRKNVKVAVQGDTKNMELVSKYVGKYIGYVFESSDNLEGKFVENEFWVNGVVAVAIIRNRLYLVAERDVYPVKGVE